MLAVLANAAVTGTDVPAVSAWRSAQSMSRHPRVLEKRVGMVFGVEG
jgi:hypothetical protein